jgi:hypothetical protein
VSALLAALLLQQSRSINARILRAPRRPQKRQKLQTDRGKPNEVTGSAGTRAREIGETIGGSASTAPRIQKCIASNAIYNRLVLVSDQRPNGMELASIRPPPQGISQPGFNKPETNKKA